MVLEELAGMAVAIKKGIVPTQLYMTNMGGRFESHLREVKLEQLFGMLKGKVGEARALERVNQLAAANGSQAKVAAAPDYAAKVVAATRYGSQRTLDANAIAALKEIATEAELKRWEDVLGKSGTLVARRAWGIFWSAENREKWVEYLMRTHRLTREQASLILSRVCYLPASKRKPEDTYWTLTGNNMVHTEFPNHQENVRKLAETEGFDLRTYSESITHAFPKDVEELLNTIPDFRRGYELNAELSRVLREAGIAGEFGNAGHTPEEWPEFGSVQKTLTEFKAAYDTFRAEILGLFRAAAKPAKAATASKAKIPAKAKPIPKAKLAAKAAKSPAKKAAKAVPAKRRGRR